MNNIYYKNEYTRLNNIFNTLEKTTLCIVSGQYGCGKSTLISDFLYNISCKKIVLRENHNNIDLYSSLKNVIDENKSNCELDSREYQTLDIVYSASIIHDFISICKNYPQCCLWIDDISTFDNIKTLQNIREILKILICLNSELRIFVIIECSNDKITHEINDIYYDISSLTAASNIIKLPILSSELLINYFKELFKEPILISDPMIKRICKSSFNNLLLIKRHSEYLKDTGIIYQQNNVWYCKDIDPELPYPLLQHQIEKRYQKLDNKLKKVLQKASITGLEINLNLMRHPLLILEPERKLTNIEKISNLIEIKYDIYSFETEEVYWYIANNMEEEQQIELHRLLAEHLQNDMYTKLHKDTVYEIRNKSFQIAQHYEYCGELKKSFQFYIACISYSKKISDFDSMNKCCKKVLKIMEAIYVNDYYIQFTYWNLALSFEHLSDFKSALNNYKLLLDTMSSLPGMYNDFTVSYHYGYCLRRSGCTMEAYKYLENLRKKLLPKNNEKYRKILVKTLIILIGILDQVGKTELKEKYFNQCLDLSQHFEDKSLYNELLTKSSLYYNSEISNKFMLDAFQYFNNSNKRYEAAKAAFNLGMNNIYCYNLIDAKQYISYSYEIFSAYGGNNICYPACGLGILEAINNNYQKAIEYFEIVLQFATNDFAKITSHINMCHAYRKLKNYEMAFNQLNKAYNILQKQKDDKLVLVRNYNFAQAMMYYEEINYNPNTSLEFIKKALDIELNQLGYHTYNIYLAKWIIKLSNSISKEGIDQNIIQLSMKPLTEYKQLCYDHNVMWGNFMFW